MWVSDSTDEKLYAYKLADGTRDAAKDFDTLQAAGNEGAEGLWGDGETLWASDFTDGKLYAYKMSDKSRDATKDYELAAANEQPTGIWSNGTTMYVADLFDDKVYAYRAYPPPPPLEPARNSERLSRPHLPGCGVEHGWRGDRLRHRLQCRRRL